VALLLVAGSLLAVAYVWRLVEAAYFHSPETPDEPADEAPLGILIPAWLLALANLYFGVDTRLPLAVTEMASRTLFGGAL
jgi:multicomponent Na+:H+ antiporter subunit D